MILAYTLNLLDLLQGLLAFYKFEENYYGFITPRSMFLQNIGLKKGQEKARENLTHKLMTLGFLHRGVLLKIVNFVHGLNGVQTT